MSLSGAVDMAGTAGTLFSGLSIHTHTCAYYKYVRTCVCGKNAGCIYCTFCTVSTYSLKISVFG